ncbi:MAG: STAS domain-containing protein [Oscillochloris sp.]|nr:STAS domain-containing protein [Oscillochloris sp.]
MGLDIRFCEHLSELVLICDSSGMIHFANPAAQHWSALPLSGKPFADFLSSEATTKSQLFLADAHVATLSAPTKSWELPLGNPENYIIASFRGYNDSDQIIIIGQVEAPEVLEMQRELLALTSELSEAQREQRRQNHQLQQALDEQRRLFDTISDMTAPAVPIWDRVLLLPIVGHIDSHRAEQITGQLLTRAAQDHATYVILDISGINIVDTAVAQQLIHTAYALQLLGIQPILVGINPEIAQTIVHLGIQLTGFVVHADLRSAMTYVLRRLGLLRRS